MAEARTGGASIFSALYEWERKNGGGGGGNPKVELSKTGKLRLGGTKKGVRKFHPGHRLAGNRINNIVKVKFVANNRDATRHIIQHIDYIQNRERELNEPERKFYGRDGERSREQVIDSVMKNRGDHAAMFKIILSPKQNELNHQQYTAEIMRRFEEASGIKTDWSLIEHRNTEYHHVHIVMPGKDMNGHSYRLEKEHLDLLRELANEYQYELQDLVYEREKQIQLEFGMTRDEANLLIESARDRRDMRDLDIYQPDLDKKVAEDLLRPTNWDNLHFRSQLEKQVMFNVAKDFKDLQAELSQNMQANHPELYQGLIKQLQAQEIDNQYFEQLKNFHPVEYERYANDPTLDRKQLVDRLKQAFPEWFDPIVDHLKEHQPELFSNYQKPAATDRQIMDGLVQSDPELFPELSVQIQENQQGLFAMAYLAHHNPELFNKINSEQDITRQKEMLAEAMRQFPEAMEDARDMLAAQYPDIYKHGQQEPTQTQIINDLTKTNPLLFPEATAQLQRMGIDDALYERFRLEYPDAAQKYEQDQNARAIIVNGMRSYRPDLLQEATKLVREQQPELFEYERNEPTQTEIMQSLLKERPELFPEAMHALKSEEIDKAYFDRAKEVMPDGLQCYVDDPDLDRTELHKVLRNSFPDWRQGIETELREKMPQLFEYDSPRSNTEILNELRNTHPEIFPAQQKEVQEPKPVDPVSQKLTEIRERLIDEAYFERGRDRLSDGLQAYLADSDLDRKYIIDGLRETFPEWQKDIEEQLKELHPLLFAQPEREQQTDVAKQQQRQTAEKFRHAQENARSGSRGRDNNEAILLLALAADIDKLDKQIDDQDKEPEQPGEPGKDPELSKDDQEKQTELEETAKHVGQDADKFQLGHGWAGLSGFHHAAFIGEPVDLEEEAKTLFQDQQELAQQMAEVEEHAQFIDPHAFKIEDIANTVEAQLEDHEKEKERDDRG